MQAQGGHRGHHVADVASRQQPKPGPWARAQPPAVWVAGPPQATATPRPAPAAQKSALRIVSNGSGGKASTPKNTLQPGLQTGRRATKVAGGVIPDANLVAATSHPDLSFFSDV